MTIFREDDEAEQLWKKIGVPPSRIMRCDEKDNFWQMADTGPCGPCSEIHFDQGPAVPGDDRPNGEGDRVIEIWNLVFMQFNRDASGTLHPLPKPSIDTGMGLERLAAVAQGVYSNYDSDLFTPLLAPIGDTGRGPSTARRSRPIVRCAWWRTILRAITFSDGRRHSSVERRARLCACAGFCAVRLAMDGCWASSSRFSTS